MRPFIIISLLLLPELLFGQLNLDTAKIKSEPISDTTNQAFYGTHGSLTPLAKSGNYLEIRMSVFYAPVGGFEERVISFDGTTWTATLIETGHLLYDSGKVTITKLKPRQEYPDIIQLFNDIGLFRLPNQYELNKPYRVFDGCLYSITYKIGNKYRQLNFDNPGIYKKLYRRTKAFKKYHALVNVFYNYFDKE